MFYLIITAFVALAVLLIQKLNVYLTWKNKNVPYITPIPFIGNFAPPLLKQKTGWQMLIDMYKKFYNKRYFGVYQFFQPILMIKDAELVKHITIKDFNHFSEHGTFVDADFDKIWSSNLFAMKSKRWKHMRPTLSPAFTSGKMKMMCQFMQKTAEQFTEYFTKQDKEEIPVELKDIFTKYTNDVIATTAFGLECNTMNEQENMFYLMGKKMTTFSGIRGLRFFIYRLSPLLQRILNMKIVDDDIKEFFSKVMYDTLKLRREKGLVRKDMIHLLLEAQKGVENKIETSVDKSFASTEEFSTTNTNDKIEKAPITDEDIIAQAMIFFIAGFDTASTLMCLTGYELMKNPDIQSRLRKEIDEAFDECNGQLTYERILEMKYLDMVISETLRKWPPVPFIDRKCVKTYIPPTIDGEEPLTIEKDTLLWIPVIAFHRDPKFYPNPDKFDPERFNDENKHNILPNTFIPFGNGPRNCIGSRFALLENKVMWINLLRSFEVVPSKDQNYVDTKWDTTNFSYFPIDGFKITFRKRKF